jgi:hypothetical protein
MLVSVTLADARAYVARAATQSYVTLAARKLEEMADEDVLRLYQQLCELELKCPERKHDT